MFPPRLLAITPGDGRDLVPWIVALGAAGLPALLLREPDLRALSIALAHVPVVILHQRTPGSGEAASEHGLHLHRPALQSCHSARDVARCAAPYALLSPVWRPNSKPQDVRSPLGPDRFLAIAAQRAVLALGGVDAPRYRELMRRGAYGGAICGGLFDAPSPAAAADRMRAFGCDSPC